MCHPRRRSAQRLIITDLALFGDANALAGASRVGHLGYRAGRRRLTGRPRRLSPDPDHTAWLQSEGHDAARAADRRGVSAPSGGDPERRQ